MNEFLLQIEKQAEIEAKARAFDKAFSYFQQEGNVAKNLTGWTFDVAKIFVDWEADQNKKEGKRYN